jgi:hypothetical protein
VPYVKYGKTNAELMRLYGRDICKKAYDRVHKIQNLTREDLWYYVFHPEAAVRDGVRDPVRIIGKSEPTKKTKIRAGIPRLVMSVSVVDQFVSATCADHQIEAEKSQWRSGGSPSCPGLGFTSEDVPRLKVWVAERIGKDLMGFDVSCFDWSITWWEAIVEMVTRLCLTGLPPDTWDVHPFARLIVGETLLNVSNVFCLNDGTLVTVTNSGGIVISGSKRTASTNSRHMVASIKFATGKIGRAMGDDGLGKLIAEEEARRKFAQLGKVLKQAEPLDFDELEFCSYTWRDGQTPEMNNVAKLLFHMACMREYSDEQLGAWLNLVPQRDLWAVQVLAENRGRRLEGEEKPPIGIG